ncbi:MAG TPA: MBOAT family O-acyltransferase [Polyangiaceae bacterium]|nr:MBOAT family O-acyltransferase [Polyangiaceae bacterium]
MIFNSFQFAYFFLAVWFVVAVLLRPRTVRLLLPRVSRLAVIETRNVFLLAASYVFYGAWDWRFLGLLMLSTTNDFVLGRAMSNTTDARRRRLYITLSVTANLCLLGFFKYFNFFADSFAALCQALGVEVRPLTLQVILPVGISFYTFQSLAYTIDVYRGTLKAEKNPLRFAAFVAFFPQLVAGPIERPRLLIPQFLHMRHVTWERVSTGSFLMGVGLFKKVVIADTAARVADAAFALQQPTGLQVLLGVYAFAFQIYADFSGYSDIARGAARCLGFELSRNFNMPYFSASPSEFWTRWHISLSSWLRDYLYIPLGGNRKGRGRTYLNLMLTMLLGGLWHGAAWTYILWGALHGLVLCLYRAVQVPVERWAERQAALVRRALRVLAVVGFFHLVCVSWLFFRAKSAAQAFQMFGALVSRPTSDLVEALAALGPFWPTAVLVSGLLVVQLLQYWRDDSWLVFRAPAPVRGLIYAVGFVLFVWIGEDGGATFIYFQF